MNRTAHAGIAGPFTLLETPEHQHLAYTESHRGSQWVADPGGVPILARKHAMPRSQAVSSDAIHIRDSKNPEGNGGDGPTFTTSPEAWSAFTAYAAR
ncbi:DUF397 domain-containing protein [Streptomyces ipomoeae]|uniref:DUF397 domain-containing protein n=1 Tax=Streptomyces ipomoeae TaxID=103232 RepID=UPI0011465D1C|nr:DUF397 domain-containing protein [Streptomyces ipomoeae]TQE28041.1 DUF397 domain-containing protein [Streptomyces ipomoeae]